MPKILENIDSTILSAADSIFQEKGFQNTDMREIAQKSGIAVGTIYHYYKSKEELYFQVIQNNWKSINSELNKISLQEENPQILLEKMLFVLINDMANRKSMHELWTEINSIYQDKGFHFNGAKVNLHQMISKQFGRIFLKMFTEKNLDENKNLSERLGSFAFVMAVNTCMLPKEQFQNEVRLITDILLTYVEKRNS